MMKKLLMLLAAILLPASLPANGNGEKYMKNLKIGNVHKFISKSSNAFNVVSDNVSYSYNGQNHHTTSSKRMR